MGIMKSFLILRQMVNIADNFLVLWADLRSTKLNSH